MNLWIGDQNISSSTLNCSSSISIFSSSWYFAWPIMRAFSTAVLLGSVALQNVLARPNSVTRAINRGSVDDFIKSEEPIALEELLCNVGAEGCHAFYAAPGIVIASPSTKEPPYFFTWTRDAALVFKAIVDRFTHKYDPDLQRLIEQYIISQAKLQGVSNPSGSFSDGSGLGEAKYEVDGKAYNGNWGRPQRDGPPLRAIAMISYANWLIENGYKSTANDLIWPVVQNDLNYVAQYWTQTGFDLWEEVRGSSFFTVSASHRALVEGATLAAALGKSGSTYTNIAPQILCFLQTFWVSNGAYLDANINTNDGRAGKDANTLLASTHNFDPSLGCDASTFQPCSDKALANLKAVVDSFRPYKINQGIPAGKALAIGRYIEDVFFNGNPWYLATLATAEQLYDAIYVWKKDGSITVTDTSLPFFRDLVPNIATGTYAKSSATYTSVINAVSTYADGFVAIVAKYTPDDGSLSEQFSKENGQPLSAVHLTWSYAAFLTAAERRAGIVPPAWGNKAATVIPGTCSSPTAQGTYQLATVTSFPPNQKPKNGSSTSPKPPCTTSTTLAVTFRARVPTQFGQTVRIIGNVASLGNWDMSKAPVLSASEYTDQNPVWKATINLNGAQIVEYKYVKVNQDGSVVWEGGANHAYMVRKTCAKTSNQNDFWQ